MIRLLCVLLFIAGCSFKKNNQTLKGHEELYSRPEPVSKSRDASHQRRVVVAATNDLHGNYLPETISVSDSQSKDKTEVRVGGKKVISQYFSILKNAYKDVVLVDSGDIFPSPVDPKLVGDFYEDLGYDSITLGLRDFNLKVPSSIGSTTELFKKFSKDSKVPLLLTNLYELKTARGVEWEGTKSHIIKDLDGVKVGIIGLVPDDIVEQTPVQNRVGLFVESMLQSTLRHARLLRSLGADIIVVTTHQGLDCHSVLADESKLPSSKVNFDPLKEKVCNKKNILGEYIDRLPPQLVDVIVGGRTHEKMANMVNGIVVLAGFPDGQSFSHAELVVDTKTKKVIPEKTVIHQPVRFCHEFFKETNDCYTEDTSIDHRQKIPAKFLGQQITPDKNVALSKRKPVKMNVAEAIRLFSADLAFVPETSGDTQIVLMEVTGTELSRILEEDFNSGRKQLWQPSPFLQNDDVLSISISGLEIESMKNYQVLADLESLQHHPVLSKRLTGDKVTSKNQFSWNSGSDEISTMMAAQVR